MNHLKLTNDKLQIDEICALVTSPNCGAISSFIGTTRDNFEDKKVVKLEYEAYESMALKAMRGICSEIRKEWPAIAHIAIYHRLGCVPVQEASIVIAISSPHRADAIKATEFCIDQFKKSVPIWKKEVYDDMDSAWKENKEFPNSYFAQSNIDVIEQELYLPPIAQHLIQIQASSDEINQRIVHFMERKRTEVNKANVRDFCQRDPLVEDEFSCARIDSILKKRKDSKSHLQVNKIYNKQSYVDQTNIEYLRCHIPRDSINERVRNLEFQLSLNVATPKDIYMRLKLLEERLLHLESISPEYIQFWDKTHLQHINTAKKKKKVYSIEEIDNLISQVRKRRKT